MPRGFMLVRYEGQWKKAQIVLAEMQSDPEFARTTGCIVESWVACMGGSDIGMSIFGVSVEALRNAAQEVRTRLSGDKNEAFVLTNTIIGSTMREQVEPFHYSVAALQRRLEDLQKKEKERDKDAASVARRDESLRTYLIEQTDSMLAVLSGRNTVGKLSKPEVELFKALKSYQQNGTGLKDLSNYEQIANKLK